MRLSLDVVGDETRPPFRRDVASNGDRTCMVRIVGVQ
jgi:hypothetical protein